MTQVIRYEIPFRPDFNATLVLPRDLTIKDAIRLNAFIESLIMPDEAKLPEGV